MTADTVRGVRLVAAACPRAQAAGVEAGQKLSDARAVCPVLTVHEADPAGDEAALVRLARWCERYSPLAAADAPDGLWLDITGCAHLWGGEAALAEDLCARLARAGHRSQAAVADTPGAAWALARVMGPGVRIVQGPEVLDALPIAILRLEPRTVGELRRVGLRTVGEMARLGRGELSARFGPAPVLRLDQATGRVAEQIAWPRAPAAWEERLALAEPIQTPDDLWRALDLLTERLCVRLRAEGQGGRLFTAEFFRVDGERPAVTVATALPTREAPYLHKLLAAKLDTVDPGFGVEVVRLVADRLARLPPTQGEMAGPGGEEAGRLMTVLDRVINRSGPERVWRSAPQGSHVPERAAVRAAVMNAPAWPDEDEPEGSDPDGRPLRLMARPEPIDAMAVMPDEPPLRFTWRGASHRVRAATGPERIAREWWRVGLPDGEARPEADRVRDYYRVEDTEGARFWVFRAGMAPGRWFLHGVFG